MLCRHIYTLSSRQILLSRLYIPHFLPTSHHLAIFTHTTDTIHTSHTTLCIPHTTPSPCPLTPTCSHMVRTTYRACLPGVAAYALRCTLNTSSSSHLVKHMRVLHIYTTSSHHLLHTHHAAHRIHLTHPRAA